MTREDIGKITKDYIVFVNNEALTDNARKQGFEYVVFEPHRLTTEDIALLEEYKKVAVRINFRNGKRGYYAKKLADSDVIEFVYDLYGLDIDGGKKVKTIEDAMENFPAAEEIEEAMEESGIILCNPDICGNCHKRLNEGDEYSRYCGTLRGEGDFDPSLNIMSCVYAPPIATTHRCVKCGYSWTVTALGRDSARFCPKCRGELDTEAKPRLYGKPIGDR